jgi:hypothetical protein
MWVVAKEARAHGSGIAPAFIYLCGGQRGIHGMALLFRRFVGGSSMHRRLVVDRTPDGGAVLD